MKKLSLGLGALMLLALGAGCVVRSNDESHGLGYVVKNTSVSKEEVPARSVFGTSSALAAMSQECGMERDAAFYDEQMAKLDGKTALVYDFTAMGDVQAPSTWTVTLVPNVFGYGSTAALKKDFDICAAGGNMYPTDVNEDWLVFESSCGTGYSDDSDRKVGCDEAKKNSDIWLR